MRILRKIIYLIICFLVLLSVAFVSEAASIKIVYDGKAHTYNAEPIYLNVNGERLNPPMAPIIFGGSTVVPARAVFDELGAKVVWDPKTEQVFVKNSTTDITLKINSSTAYVNGQQIKINMPAKIINGNTMIPTRFVAEKLGLKVGWDNTNRIISISNEKSESGNGLEISNVSVSSENGKTLVKVEATGEIIKYRKMELDSPDRIVIDIPDSTMKVEKTSIPVSGSELQRIRVSQYSDSPKESRIVLDLAKKTEYAINVSDDKKSLTVGFEGSEAANVKVGGVEDFSEFNTKLGGTNKVSIDKGSDKTGIYIQIDSTQNCSVSRLTDDDAIAVDLTNANFSEEGIQIPINDKTIKYLKSQKISGNNGRIIIGVEGQPSYQVFQEPGKVSVYIVNPTYKNISYQNANDTSTIVINNADISEKVSVLDDKENSRTIFSIPVGTADIGYGSMMNINDSLVKSIEITDDLSQGTQIAVNHNYEGRMYYNIVKGENNSTIINISSKNQASVPAGKFLVVIDAGHGGYDPGAKYKNELQEKDLNLDIALRLNKLLKDAGVETVMTRDKDVFVVLHERANIANRLNADLFISIHNNWIDIPSYGGTMTLYYPSDDITEGLAGKRYAQVVQEELLKQLGTTDRKIIPRPNLVVLNSTEMPSVLAEIGFMSNESDRLKLITPEFKQSAAVGLCNGIMKALSELK